MYKVVGTVLILAWLLFSLADKMTGDTLLFQLVGVAELSGFQYPELAGILTWLTPLVMGLILLFFPPIKKRR